MWLNWRNDPLETTLLSQSTLRVSLADGQIEHVLKQYVNILSLDLDFLEKNTGMRGLFFRIKAIMEVFAWVYLGFLTKYYFQSVKTVMQCQPRRQ